MNYQFRPAVKSAAKLLVGVYSESGNGKTYSALLLARGFVGPQGRIGMVETESGRGEIYVSVIPGGYEVCSISGSFSPEDYGKAIAAAEAQKFDALIIDSASHEWESIGGVLDMAAKNQQDGKKGPLVWQRPKLEHAKHFVLRLMASPIPLVIVNMRARYPMKEQKKPNGEKEWVRSDKLEPKQSDDILFEMLIHGWIDDQHRYHVTKYPNAIPELRDVVKDGDPLSIETGQRLAQWAHGRAAPKQDALPTPGAPASTDVLTQIITTLGYASETLKKRFAAMVATYGVKKVEDLSVDDQRKALTWLKSQLDREAASTPTT